MLMCWQAEASDRPVAVDVKSLCAKARNLSIVEDYKSLTYVNLSNKNHDV